MSDGRPEPELLGDEAEFVLALKALKAWSGVSFREIEVRARAAGLRLPFSTASGMLGRTTLPREDLLVAFTTACGLDEDEVAAWVATRKRLAVAAVIVGGERAVASGVALPVVRRTFRRRFAVAGCGLLVAAGVFVSQGAITHDVEVSAAEVTVQSAY